uniref:PNPLA domain-containing protein n=1 Tax=Pseudo-nitzschia australis TaxID=44445 RepID=A0A6U9YZ04_9STRA
MPRLDNNHAMLSSTDPYNNKRDMETRRKVAAITMSSSKLSPIIAAASSRVWCFWLGFYLWSLAFVSAFRPGPFTFSSNNYEYHHPFSTRIASKTTTTTAAFLAPLSSAPHSFSPTSSSTVVMETIPSGRKRKKFQQVRKRLFSRTRRGYRNDGVIDEGVVMEPQAESQSDNEHELGDDLNNDLRKAEIGARIRAITEEHQRPQQKSTKKRERYVPYFASLTRKKKKNKPEPILIETVDELRHAILDQQLSLCETVIVERKTKNEHYEQQQHLDDSETTKKAAIATAAVVPPPPVLDHAVRDLIQERFINGTTPGQRLLEDTATLAIAIEGGGMRGCVSAGMVAAITALGLSDTIDSIYGSSAGSVVGAYMVSRQVCLDVYVDILPASKKLFVCKKRMATNLASLGLGQMLGKSGKSSKSKSISKKKNGKKEIDFVSSPTLSVSPPPTPPLSSSPRTNLRERLIATQPGMNISFVLDGIMGNDHGLRPLDVETFRKNNERQKLRVVSSCVDPESGKLLSKCFGHNDFFCAEESLIRVDHEREGIFACLQASMTVPGATGPPVNLVRRNDPSSNPLPCFDAFCFEPIPYRSAVEEGATHVLVLASRPEDYMPKTKPGIYETGVAPLYFNSHGQKGVAEYFEKGGQQYVYAEDLMLLQEARLKGSEGILVPPPEILYGVPRTNEMAESIRDREKCWKKAHLFPLRVPKGYKELDVLEQDRDAVLEAIRDGFMTSFDSLKDIVGLEDLEGTEVAKLIFPSSSGDEDQNLETSNHGGKASSLSPREEEILRTKLHVPGEPIPKSRLVTNEKSMEPSAGTVPRRRRIFRRSGGGLFGHGKHDETDENEHHYQQEQHQQRRWHEEDFTASTLLQCLPGFQGGKYGHLAKGLIEQQ